MHWLIEPGFFSSASVRTALIVGALASIVSALTGVFVLLRRQTFAGHALSDVATAGGSGASLAALSPMAGFLGASILGAGAMHLVGARRVRSRDLTTGIVLGAATGVSALFLFLASTRSSSSSSTQQILFGSIFSVSASLIPVASTLTIAALLTLAWCRGPLLLDSINDELALVRGINARRVSAIFLILLAVGVSLSSLVLGSILSTALLIGPAAAALRVAGRMVSTLAYAAVFSIAATWLGTLLSYNSYYWSSSHRALPVSFFVVLTILVIYGAAVAVSRRRVRRAR